MSEEFYEQDRILYEVRPVFSVFQPELGHLPYVVLRFEKNPDEPKALDLCITVGGGAFGNGDDPEDVAEFLRDVADMIVESDEVELDMEDPDNWD